MNTLLFLVTLFVAASALAQKRTTHEIQMNSDVNPELYRKVIKLEAHIDEFMDIICPQYPEGKAEDEMELFYLYQVTDKKAYDVCAIEAKKNPILSCDSPVCPTKLTIKFQKISPYPIGFTFQEGKTYYYIGVPKGYDHKKKHHNHPCNNLIRLEVKVTKKKTNLIIPDLKTVFKESTTLRTTTTVKTTTLSRVLTTRKSVARSPSSDRQSDGGGNAALRVHYVTLMTSLLALLTLYINM
ncbi:ephrin-A1-like [Styela clava]